MIFFLRDIGFHAIGLWLHWRMLGRDVAKTTPKFCTWVKLICYKWGNIIFPIITSKGYLGSKNNYLNIELACLLGRDSVWKWWYSLCLSYGSYESDLNSLLQMGPFGRNHFITIICCWIKMVCAFPWDWLWRVCGVLCLNQRHVEKEPGCSGWPASVYLSCTDDGQMCLPRGPWSPLMGFRSSLGSHHEHFEGCEVGQR